MLPAFMCIHHMYTEPTEARRGHQSLLKPKSQVAARHHVVLEIEPGSSVTAESSLQSPEWNL